MAPRLNIKALEAGLAVVSEDGANTGSFDVSRRQAMGLAGLAAAAGFPAVRAFTSHAAGFTVTESRGKIAFRRHGVDAWTIDTARFGGSPRLQADTRPDEIVVRLNRATYPGTSIRSDFIATIRNGLAGWRMSIEMPHLNFRAQVAFEPWLDGNEKASGRAVIRKSRIDVTDQSSLVIGGRAAVTFSPDWRLRIKGSNLARVQGLGSDIASDDLTLRLLAPSDPSSLNTTTSRRTLLSLRRAEKAWSIDLPSTPNGSKLEVVDSGFDRINLEVQLTRAGRTRAALTALSDRGDGDSLAFYPSDHLLGSDGDRFRISLAHARYALSGSGAQWQAALTATFSVAPAWTHVDGCAIAMGQSPAAEPFRLLSDNGKTALRCAPAILGVAGGMSGAMVEPRPLRRPTVIDIAYGRRRKRSQDTAHLTIARSVDRARHDVLIPNYVISILRPEDLLSLRLEYYGFDLVAGGENPPMLVSDGSAGFVLVVMAPQNIAEEAFFETQGSGPKLPSTDPDANSSNETPKLPGTLAANISGVSRLAFDIPNSVQSIPYALANVLDWSAFTQRVVPIAVPPGQQPGSSDSTAITEPLIDQTAIEAPYRLTISPNRYAYWNHTPALVTGVGGEVELWHTRLGVKSADGTRHDDNDPVDSSIRTVRAVWSPDYTSDINHPPPSYVPSGPHDPLNPYRASLDALDRYAIVRSTSDFNTVISGTSDAYDPSPVQVDRLALSSLGAWIDFRGHWNPQADGLSLVEWKHRATMARDHYVKVVKAGYLFPFGHKACLVKVTERKLQRMLTRTGKPGPLVAYLFQHLFIEVREPLKTYYSAKDPGAPSRPDYPSSAVWPAGYEGRQMPFKSIKLTTLVTPDIEDPATASTGSAVPNPPGSVQPDEAFWPLVLVNGSSTNFLWHAIGTDWDGTTVHFSTPLIYLDETVALAGSGSQSNYDKLANWLLPAYEKSPRSIAPIHGSKVTLAPSAPPSASGQVTDPAVVMHAVTFGAAVPPDSVANSAGNLRPDQPQFFPTVVVAEVEIPAIKHLLGHGDVSVVAIAQPFLDNGFDDGANRGEVFMHLVAPDFATSGQSKQLPLIFGRGDSGQTVTPGTVSPNLSVAGISRRIGPVGAGMKSGVSDFNGIAGGAFDPTDFFGSLLGSSLPKLFGTVSLTDILGALPDFTKYPNKIPGLKVTRTDSAILVHYVWETEQINPWPATGSVSNALFAPWLIDTNGNHTLPMNDGQPRYTSGGNIIAPPPEAAPPPIPDVSDAGTGSVDNSGADPSHVWVATYVIGGVTGGIETVGSLGALYDLSQGGIISDNRTISVAVAQNPNADGGINIYRSKVGTAWPLYLINTSSGPTIPPGIGPNQSQGMGTVTYTDTTADAGLSSTTLPSTWCQFGIEMNLTIPLDGSEPTYAITGEVAYASIQLEVLAVPFVSLTFIVQSGQKLTVKPQVNEIVFTNELQFINTLRSFLNSFSDPPFLDVTDTDVTAGFTLAIPNIDVGVFSCQNISVGAKIIIPYFGDSIAIGFTFCSQANPFLLICFIFGGGGFLEVDVSPKGLEGLQIGLDAAASMALDIVVASGQVHAMVGVNFDYEAAGGVTLTAIVDIGGSVEVLGIFNTTVDFHVQLSYSNDNGNSSLSGEAELQIEVPVEFFSIPVTLGPIRKTFVGSPVASSAIRESRLEKARRAKAVRSDNAIPVGTMVQADTWADYINAFAN